MECSECNEDIPQTKPEYSLTYHGKKFLFCSSPCRNKFSKKIFDNDINFTSNSLPGDKGSRFNRGEYPDPEDLKYHGDINCWTDERYE